jgi:hypothetical protein
MLSAYLEDAELVSIFGADMLNDPDMLGLLRQLSGMEDDKPFECVGTREEVNTAIAMSIARHKAQGKELPLLYKEYEQSSYYPYWQNKTVDWDQFNPRNLLPENYAALLKAWLREKKS